MKRLMAAVLTGVVLCGAISVRAQDNSSGGKDTTKPQTDGQPDTETLGKPRKDAPAKVVPYGIPAPPGCPNLKILWYDRFIPIPLLTPREVIVPEIIKSLDVVYKPEKCTITELVIKSREEKQAYPCTTYVPVKVTDPITHVCSTVMEPRTEMKVRTVTIWYAVPEKREVLIDVPYVKEVEDILEHRTILLEYTTDLLRKGGAMKIESGENKKPFYLHTPPEHCPVPHH